MPWKKFTAVVDVNIYPYISPILFIYIYMGMDQYLLIPFLVGWTSIYQLFWCSPGVQGFDPLPYNIFILSHTKLSIYQALLGAGPVSATQHGLSRPLKRSCHQLHPVGSSFLNPFNESDSEIKPRNCPIEHGDLAIGNGDSIGKVATTMGFNGISPTTMGISWRF